MVLNLSLASHLTFVENPPLAANSDALSGPTSTLSPQAEPSGSATPQEVSIVHGGGTQGCEQNEEVVPLETQPPVKVGGSNCVIYI